MSPEQVRGLAVDHRSDVFSFGSVLFEMLSGKRAFLKSSSVESMNAILNEDPAEMSEAHGKFPLPLERVLRRCLEKNPEDRFQSARDLAFALDALSAVRTPPRLASLLSGVKRRQPAVLIMLAALTIAVLSITYFARVDEAIHSVAILPFLNAVADPNAEYVSDGISDGIISRLSQLPNLKVISFSSVLRYKGQPTEPQAVGRELNVRAILISRLLQRGDELAISTELVDVRDNRRIWGERYSRRVSELLRVQEEIARDISDKLQLRLTGEEQRKLAKSYTQDAEAYRLYLKGRFHFNKYNRDGQRKAIEYFTEAVDKDPHFALAYAGLADVHIQLGLSSGRPAAKEAKTYAERALALDNTLAEAHVPLGAFRLLYEWDGEGAERELKRALELNANYTDAYHFYGHYLQAVGQPTEAIGVFKRALELDPLSLILNYELGVAHDWARQSDQAITQVGYLRDSGDPN